MQPMTKARASAVLLFVLAGLYLWGSWWLVRVAGGLPPLTTGLVFGAYLPWAFALLFGLKKGIDFWIGDSQARSPAAGCFCMILSVAWIVAGIFLLMRSGMPQSFGAWMGALAGILAGPFAIARAGLRLFAPAGLASLPASPAGIVEWTAGKGVVSIWRARKPT